MTEIIGHVIHYFNPRTREGCDDDDGKTSERGKTISIHAPARGATLAHRRERRHRSRFQSTHPRGVRLRDRYYSVETGNFNPRTREGCDLPQRCLRLHLMSFQSTHPRGVRLSRTFRGSSVARFQSTHPRGVRLKSFHSIRPKCQISIHAPARGATKFIAYVNI